MGILDKLFKTTDLKKSFVPDFMLSEYDNWINFLDSGGTTKEWDELKSKNAWVFKRDTAKTFAHYRKELEPVSTKYFSILEKIQKDWSVLYNLKDYTGNLADIIEYECLEDIDYFKKMHEINIKYGESSPTNIPAFKRLAMLYEKQGKYEESVSICKQACSYGMDERSRMIRMIKKAGREPSEEELSLLEQQYN